MTVNTIDAQKFGRDNVELATKSIGAVSKGFQAIAAEVADYSKKSFEEGSSLVEKIIGAKTMDKAIEIQSAYAKTAYETYLARMTKIGELYADMAKASYKPVEAAFAKAK